MPPQSRTGSAMVVWLSGDQRFAADPIATIDLGYSDWRALGARFVDLEDAIGGVSRLAVGRLDVDGRRFAVLDHDEDVTYLLAEQADAADVLSALETLGVAPERVLERLSPESGEAATPGNGRRARTR